MIFYINICGISYITLFGGRMPPESPTITYVTTPKLFVTNNHQSSFHTQYSMVPFSIDPPPPPSMTNTLKSQRCVKISISTNQIGTIWLKLCNRFKSLVSLARFMHITTMSTFLEKARPLRKLGHWTIKLSHWTIWMDYLPPAVARNSKLDYFCILNLIMTYLHRFHISHATSLATPKNSRVSCSDYKPTTPIFYCFWSVLVSD